MWSGRRDSNPRPSPWQKNVPVSVHSVTARTFTCRSVRTNIHRAVFRPCSSGALYYEARSPRRTARVCHERDGTRGEASRRPPPMHHHISGVSGSPHCAEFADPANVSSFMTGQRASPSSASTAPCTGQCIRGPGVEVSRVLTGQRESGVTARRNASRIASNSWVSRITSRRGPAIRRTLPASQLPDSWGRGILTATPACSLSKLRHSLQSRCVPAWDPPHRHG